MTDYQKEKYWSKVADSFDQDQRYIAGADLQQAIIKKLSGESELGELIELGCGAGFFTKALAPNVSHITATDISDEMLAVARTQLKALQNVTVEKADCFNIAFSDGKFDSVFMANLIHVVENPQLVLQESHRVMKDGGRLLIVSYTSHGMKGLDKIKTVIRVLRRWGKPPGYFRGNLSPDELRLLVESAGFQVEEVQLIGDKTKALYLRGRKREG